MQATTGGTRQASVGSLSMITRHGRSARTVSTVLPNRRRADPRRQRHDERVGAHRARLLDDQPAAAAGTHALDMAVHAPPALQPGALDDGARGDLLLGQLRVQRRGLRDGDQHEHVDAAALRPASFVAVAIVVGE